MDAQRLTKQMYQAILNKDIELQKKLKLDMLKHNLQLHKENKPITSADTVFVG